MAALGHNKLTALCFLHHLFNKAILCWQAFCLGSQCFSLSEDCYSDCWNLGLLFWSTGALNQGESNMPRCLGKLRSLSIFMNHHRLHRERGGSHQPAWGKGQVTLEPDLLSPVLGEMMGIVRELCQQLLEPAGIVNWFTGTLSHSPSFKDCFQHIHFGSSSHNVVDSIKSIIFPAPTQSVGGCILWTHSQSPDVNKKAMSTLGKHLVFFFFV